MIINQHRITGETQLTELTLQINQLCEQAEDNHALVILRLEACSGKLSQITIQDVNRWERAIRRLERLPAAVMAVASGQITGPALDLLLATDYRIASADFCLFMTLSDNGHVWPGMMIHRLVNQIGLSRSRRLIIGTQQLTAHQALDAGLVDELSNTEQDTLAAAARLMPISGTEIAIRRQLIFDATTTTFEDAVGTHLAACDRELRRLVGKQPENARNN